jgi:hypothetical protein
MWPNGYVLNEYRDGTKDMNDGHGLALDPDTGHPLQGTVHPPVQDGVFAHDIEHVIHGTSGIATLAEAGAHIAHWGPRVLAVVEPVGMIVDAAVMIYHVLRDLGTEERAAQAAGFYYAVFYGALDMGHPPDPPFQSLRGPAQDDLDRIGWRTGVDEGRRALASGVEGVKLRNRILLRVAHDGDAGRSLNLTWKAHCERTGERALGRVDLRWPNTGIP